MSLVVVIIIEQRVLHYFKCISISTGSQISDHYHMHQKDKQMVLRSFIFFECLIGFKHFGSHSETCVFYQLMQKHLHILNPCPFISGFVSSIFPLLSPKSVSVKVKYRPFHRVTGISFVEILSENLIFWSPRNLQA